MAKPSGVPEDLPECRRLWVEGMASPCGSFGSVAGCQPTGLNLLGLGPDNLCWPLWDPEDPEDRCVQAQPERGLPLPPGIEDAEAKPMT